MGADYPRAPVARTPRHVRPTAALAERVLLPGDPGRALLLAQELTSEPRMFNHARGLWGYTGTAADGRPLTIMSHGMGGPSAAIVVEELCDLGLESAIRVGTCGALDPRLTVGDLVAATSVLAADGTSRALGAGDEVSPDPALADALSARADHSGLVVSTDLFYDPDPGRADGWRAAGAIAVEMEAATVLTVAARRSCRAACLLAVSDTAPGGGDRIGDEELEAASLRLGRAALEAFAVAGC
jgi:DeoD family purine-nucleoside phosphorylase